MHGDQLGGCYHNTGEMMEAWARVWAVKVVKSSWNSGDILKAE